MPSSDIGPLVLAGSGEYTPAMDILDTFLIQHAAGRPIILIATSCAQEGVDVMTRWEQQGLEHFRRLGVEATPVRIRDNDDADMGENASQIADAGAVWFSGGSSAYLAQAFHNTKSWHALESANRNGAAVAGASGGLGVLNPDASTSSDTGPTGLGLADPVRAIAHFDRFEQRRPESLDLILRGLRPGQTAAGVDEDTTVVWTGGVWRVMGHKRVVVFAPDHSRTIFHNGDEVPLPPPARSLPTAK